MKGDRLKRHNAAVIVAALVALLTPSASFGEADANAKIDGADTSAEAPGTEPASSGTTDPDKEAQSRFDQLMKSAENAEDMSTLESEAPPPPGLSGAVQTNVLDSDEPLVKVPGINVPIGGEAPKTGPTKASLEGVKAHYQKGRWKDALDMIAQLKPSDKTHYYAGLCYQGQGQLLAASGEFRWVAAYSKDPMIRYNAAQAIIAVASYSKMRTAYKGQGNNFARTPAAGRRGGGGGGGAVRRG